MIDFYPPAVHIQLVQAVPPKQGSPASPSEPPMQISPPAQRQPSDQTQPAGGSTPAPAQAQPELPVENPDASHNVEVIPYDIGHYLPDTADYAIILVTITPPTGTILVYTPGFEATPFVFRGPRMSGEVRLNGPTLYLHLQDGATGYEVQIINWREP